MPNKDIIVDCPSNRLNRPGGATLIWEQIAFTQAQCLRQSRRNNVRLGMIRIPPWAKGVQPYVRCLTEARQLRQ
jgi:hypothetical protein